MTALLRRIVRGPFQLVRQEASGHSILSTYKRSRHPETKIEVFWAEDHGDGHAASGDSEAKPS